MTVQAKPVWGQSVNHDASGMFPAVLFEESRRLRCEPAYLALSPQQSLPRFAHPNKSRFKLFASLNNDGLRIAVEPIAKGVAMNRILLFGTLACTVSAAFAHKVRVDLDHGVQFSCYKTFRWAHPPEPRSPDALFPNQLMQQRIAGFIEQALAARGIRRVTAGGDLLVDYSINVTAQPQFVTTYDSFAPGWGSGWNGGWGGWSSGWSTTTELTIYYGTLIVDITDARRNRLIFQGTSKQTISSRPERNTKKLAKAVDKVFEKYPPRA
jgi:hypothetical protein